MLPTTVPAGPIPSGMTSNFTNPQYDGERFAAVTITFLSLAVIIVSLRLYTQLILLKRAGFDDCECFGSTEWKALNQVSGRRYGPGYSMSFDLY